jgi:DNA-binding MarR family transcriptional regulator
MSIPLEDIGRAVKRLQHRHHRALDSRLLVIGSSLAQWDALRAMHRNSGASSHALAEYTFQTDQSFGTLAARLLEKGLATRAPGKGRAITYTLTPTGKDLLRKGTSLAEKILSESFASLSEAERKQLHALMLQTLGGS